MEKKNILIIVPTLSSGGAERVATNLASSLKKKYNVKIAVFDAKQNVYDHEVEIIDLQTASSKNMFKKIYNHILRIVKLRKIKKQYKIDCSISFLTTPNLVNILSRRKDKVIVSIRNKMSELSKGILKRFIVRISTNPADSVVVLSKKVKKDQINEFKTNSKKIQVIYNACDVEKILQQAMTDKDENMKNIFTGDPVVVTAGRSVYQKGQWHLIRAFKEVVKIIPNAKLIILGTGELQNYLKQLIDELNLDKNVKLLGFQNNPYKYMINSDIFVFTSMFEGLGNILLEAMACKLPIISTDCDAGPREILAPESDLEKSANDIEMQEYGVLIPVCDGNYYKSTDEITNEEKKIADSIIKLLTDKKLNENYRNKSSLRINDFNKESITKQWIEIIENICSK